MRQRKIDTNRPTTTGGSPIPVFTRLTRTRRPGKRVSASAVPAETPSSRLSSVAVPEMRSESREIRQTSASRPKIRPKASRIPCQIRSISALFSCALRGPVAADLHRAPFGPPVETSPPRHPFAVQVIGYSALPASGKKSGEPNFSTPKPPIVFCVASATMKSAKAFAPAALTFGHFAWLTSMTW